MPNKRLRRPTREAPIFLGGIERSRVDRSGYITGMIVYFINRYNSPINRMVAKKTKKGGKGGKKK